MNASARVEYACVAMFELALCNGTRRPVRVREISERHGVSARFLAQILLQLKSAGLVTSSRGAAGGYLMVRGPENVTLGEVVDVVEGRHQADSSLSSESNSSVVSEALNDAWMEADRAKRERLHGITLAELVERANERADEMYYI